MARNPYAVIALALVVACGRAPVADAACDTAALASCSLADPCASLQGLLGVDTVGCVKAVGCCAVLDSIALASADNPLDLAGTLVPSELVGQFSTEDEGCTLPTCDFGHGQTPELCNPFAVAACFETEDAQCGAVVSALSSGSACFAAAGCCSAWETARTAFKSGPLGALETEDCPVPQCGAGAFLRVDWAAMLLIAAALGVYVK